MRSLALLLPLLLAGCGPHHGGGEDAGVPGTRSRLPRQSLEGGPQLSILVPEGWVLEDRHAAAQEGLLNFFACVESKTLWEWGGSGPLAQEKVGASVCVDWGPGAGAPPLETTFEGLYPPPKLEWELPGVEPRKLYASRRVSWGAGRAVQIHGWAGYLHEQGRLRNDLMELGTLENLALRTGDSRVALAGWIPPGASPELSGKVYREMHAILLSIAPAP